MEIINRSKKHGNEGDLLIGSFGKTTPAIKEEVLRRSAKAGYTTRNGEPTHGTKIMGPGIGNSKLNVWPRDKHGNLIGD
jgi:hypothetical protein